MNTFNLNSTARFKGYADPLAEGQTPILQVGETVSLYDYGRDHNGQVIPDSFRVVAQADVDAGVPTDKQRREMLFINELEAIPTEAVAEVVEAPAETPVAAPVVAPVEAAPAPAPVTAPAVVATPAPDAAPAAPAKKKRGRPAKTEVAPAPEAVTGTPAVAEPVVEAPVPVVEAAPEAPVAAPAPRPRGRPPGSTKPEEVINPTPFALQIVGSDALAAADRLVSDRGQNDYALGATLSFIRSNKVHLQITDNGEQTYAGEGGFERYIAERLGQNYRSACQKIEAYEGVARLGLDAVAEQRLIAAGYTKLKDLVKIMKPENALELVQFAETHNAVEVQNHVRVTRVNAGDPGVRNTDTAEKRTFKFKVHNERGVIVENALNAAQVQGGEGATLDDALVIMAERFLESVNTEAVPLEAELERLENTFGVKLTVGQPATAEAPVTQQA